MLNKVLIANRGEIACRIIRTLRRMGIRSVAVYSEADRHARHVREADEAYCLGGAAPSESYLNQARILAVAREAGVDGIHPGYGFLSENASFAEACEAAGIAFCGPTAEQMRLFGLKHTARDIARQSGTPLLPGTDVLADVEEALAEAERIGYPVMLKSSAGGGGIGMRLCADAGELRENFTAVVNLSQANFGESAVFLEKAITRARHIEVQVFGDGHGQVHTLGERDCSLQRRHQKVVEETPAPGLSEEVRDFVMETARRLAASVKYRSAGTVEFLYDVPSGQAYFLEMNTRLQVEHPVTEEVWQIDLVEAMVRLAGGDTGFLAGWPEAPRGAAIEVRLYAEDPARHFRPDCGLVTAWEVPDGIRCDSWIEAGTEVTPYYDPLLAKIIASGPDRASALAQLQRGLDDFTLGGLSTNLAYLRTICRDPDFVRGEVSTRHLSTLVFAPPQCEVVDPGVQTTVQDYPGRIGYWHVGVPPSGPMDSLSFRMGNYALGNPVEAPGLECTVRGPTLKFFRSTRVCLTGAVSDAKLDGQPVPWGRPFTVETGQVLQTGQIIDRGQRFYLLFAGGLEVPAYLGSAATFILGRFGGHGGRVLATGDVLTWPLEEKLSLAEKPPLAAPELPPVQTIGVLSGPHGSPDFLTPEYLEEFLRATWEIHFNSARTGVRLIGPKPQWVREDGGEAGLHPSNLHDNAYAVGAIDFTGDMPVILGPDGPSLGGFVCPFTVASAELWKLGQLRPGDEVRFHLLTPGEALDLQREREAFLTGQGKGPCPALRAARPFDPVADSPILATLPEGEDRPAVMYRRSGDCAVLVEYGPMVLDLALRLRVQVLFQQLEKTPPEWLEEMTPGIRSLQIRFLPGQVGEEAVVRYLQTMEEKMPPTRDLTIPSRIVHLPLSWDDESTREAIRRYMSSVNPQAPWCPDNIEFIRRINGLDSVEEVKRIVFSAHYLVMGLGDVYLGAPVATPLDPRHRLVTTKYNPARTWTPENAVGIGGAYLCVYGMEGPGGYQFVGRTVQMWNRYRQTKDFRDGKPWLLRFFDQIRFYPVSPDELIRLREEFIEGRFSLQVEEQMFSFGDYEKFLHQHDVEIAAFREKQRRAFQEERERWAAAGLNLEVEAEAVADSAEPTIALPEGAEFLAAPMPGSVWKLPRSEPGTVEENEVLLILESMKMEIPVRAPARGKILEIHAREHQPVKAGQSLFTFQPLT